MDDDAKYVILIRGSEFDGEARIRSGGDPKHEFLRRIEKENFEADHVFIAERVPTSTVRAWLVEAAEKEAAFSAEEEARAERAMYERLKKKFEG